MQVVLKKYYRNFIVSCEMVFKYVSSFKKYALKNIAIHVMCIFAKNITTHKEKEWNIYFFKLIN